MQTKAGGCLGSTDVGQGGEISGEARVDPEGGQIFLYHGVAWCLSVSGQPLLVWGELVTASHSGDHVLDPRHQLLIPVWAASD